MVTVAVYQPRYFPRLHYIARAKQADVFVLYDDVEFSRQSPQHRARIRFGGKEWMTVPIKHSSDRMPIAAAEIDMSKRWRRTHLNTIQAKYGGNSADTFSAYYENLGDNARLVELTIPLLEDLFERFGVESTIIRSSSLEFDRVDDPSSKLANLVASLDGDHYISGGRGYRNYLDEATFQARGIDVSVQDWEPDWPDGNVCCLDAIFDVEDPKDYANP